MGSLPDGALWAQSPRGCEDCGTDLPTPRHARTVRCAPCQKEHSRALRREISQRYKDKVRADPELARRHQDVYNERRRARRLSDPSYVERERERQRLAAAERDPEKKLERQAYAREWRRKNRDKVNASAKRNNRALREEVLHAYGGKCACCGESQYEFLAIDHVGGRGEGAAHRRELTKGRGGRGAAGVLTYRWLRKQGFPDGFRVLCHNCNCAYGFYGFCPHEEQK